MSLSLARRLRHIGIKARRWQRGAELSPQARFYIQQSGKSAKVGGKIANPKATLDLQKGIRSADRASQKKANNLLIGTAGITPIATTAIGVGASRHYSNPETWEKKNMKNMNLASRIDRLIELSDKIDRGEKIRVAGAAGGLAGLYAGEALQRRINKKMGGNAEAIGRRIAPRIASASFAKGKLISTKEMAKIKNMRAAQVGMKKMDKLRDIASGKTNGMVQLNKAGKRVIPFKAKKAKAFLKLAKYSKLGYLPLITGAAGVLGGVGAGAAATSK